MDSFSIAIEVEVREGLVDARYGYCCILASKGRRLKEELRASLTLGDVTGRSFSEGGHVLEWALCYCVETGTCESEWKTTRFRPSVRRSEENVTTHPLPLRNPEKHKRYFFSSHVTVTAKTTYYR